MRSTGSTASAAPVVIAARGMLSNLASVGSCTKVMPPAALTAPTPSAPSEAVPESTTAMLRSWYWAARALKK